MLICPGQGTPADHADASVDAGSDGAPTAVRICFNGKQLQADISQGDLVALRQVLSPWLSCARRPTDDVEPVWLGLGAEVYELDLNAAHRNQLVEALAPFLTHARPMPDGRPGPPPWLQEDADNPEHHERRWSARAPVTPRPPATPRIKRGARVVEAARSAPVPHEDPDHPWLPFARAGEPLAAVVRAWALTQGISMPHRGVPRSVLKAYRAATAGGDPAAGAPPAPGPAEPWWTDRKSFGVPKYITPGHSPVTVRWPCGLARSYG